MRLRPAAPTLVVAWIVLGWPAATGPAGAQPAADDEVVTQLMQVLERTPRRGAALDRLYGLYVERGRLDAAIAGLRDRTKATPTDGTAWMLVGLLEAQRGRDAAAVEALGQAEKHRPRDPLASYYLGQSLVLVGRSPDAAEAFERALARNPARADLLDVFQALGRIYQRARQTDKALAVWKRLEERFPDDRRVQEQIAAALAEDGQSDLALPRYEALIQAARAANDSLKEPLYRTAAADLKARLGRRDDALKDYEALLADLPSDDWKHSDVRGRLEELFLRADDLPGLVRYYEARVEKHPEDLGAVSRLAQALVESGRTADAAVRLTRILERAPRNAALRLDLIQILVADQKPAAAAAQYAALDKVDPNNPEYLREWGRLLLQDLARAPADRQAAAAALWRRLLPAAGQKEDPARLEQVADLFRQGDMPDEALPLYRRAAELAPGPSPQRVHYGEFLHSRGQKDEALVVWREMAAGMYRDTRNLRHLAEVLGGFGYLPEALAAAEDATGLDPKDFGLRLQRADLLQQLVRYPDALAQLDEAARLAPGPEESELVLDRRIRVHQAANTLTAHLAARLADPPTTAVGRYELARTAEAARRWPEATAAIRAALEGEADLTAARRLTQARTAAARIYEGSGDFAAAANAFRKMADADRPRRADHLRQVMRLEERLGRQDAALQAGRDLIAAAPENLAQARAFAALCTRLGATDEGLEVLRRVVRASPNDPEALTALGKALAEQFRTAEAIELYWRAFDKAQGESKLGPVDELAALYARGNQFDRLVERLTRLRRAPTTRRLGALGLARAHAAAGNLGSARQELEVVLAEYPGDAAVLRQLANLAERESDLASAGRYLRLLARTDPQAESQLASLLLRSGETDAAAAIWQRQAGVERRPDRLLQLADNLLLFKQYERAGTIVDGLLRDRPRHWEALYRQGLVRAGLNKPAEAEAAFRAILALPLSDDELSELIQPRAATAAAAKAGPLPKVAPKGPGVKPTKDADNGLLDRNQVAPMVRQAVGLAPADPARRSLWSPGDFGQARMAALGWLWARAVAEKRPDAFLAELRGRARPDGGDLRPWWDLWYLSLVRADLASGADARRALVRTGLLAINWFYISGLDKRTAPDKKGPVAAPLAAADIELLLSAYGTLLRGQSDWIFDGIYETTTAELKLAGRAADADRLYKQSVEAATGARFQATLMRVAAKRGDLDSFARLLTRFEPLRNTPGAGNYNPREDLRQTFMIAMDARAEAKAYADLARLMNLFLDYVARTARADLVAASPQPPLGRMNFFLGTAFRRTFQMDFPAPVAGIDREDLSVLGNALMLHQYADLVSDLFALLQGRLDRAKPEDRTVAALALAAVRWWNGDREAAVQVTARAVEAAPGDSSLRLELARAQIALNQPDQALATLDATPAQDSSILQRREWAALEAATKAGDQARARKAAERLGGLRLSAEELTQLAGRMYQLNMPAEAETALQRAQGQAGNRNGALRELLRLFLARKQNDKVVEVAQQLLRSTPPPQPRTTGFRTEPDPGRQEALQALVRTGRLADLIARTEAQLKAAPRSMPVLQALAEYYQAAGEPAKTTDLYVRMADLRPDDAGVRYELAQRLAATDVPAALPHYLAAIRKQPRLFYFNSFDIINRFQSAGRLADLGAALETINTEEAGGYDLAQVISRLLADPKTKAGGLRLLQKTWDSAGDNRATILTYLAATHSSPVWSIPEVYDLARRAVVPGPDEAVAGDWARFNRLVPALATLTRQRGDLPALVAAATAAAARRPGWAGGRAVVAVLEIHAGRPDRARPVLAALFDGKGPAVPAEARLILVTEMTTAPALHDLAVRVCEQAVPGLLEGDDRFDYPGSLAYHLVELYRLGGRTADARDVLRKVSRRVLDGSVNAVQGLGSYELYRNVPAVTKHMLDLNLTFDTARFCSRCLALAAESGDTSMASFGDSVVREAQTRLDQTLQVIGQSPSADFLDEALTPRSGKAAGPVLDLGLLLYPREADKTAVQSLLTVAVQAAAEVGPAAELRGKLDALVTAHPDDLSVAVIAAVAGTARGDGPEAAAAIARLEAALARTPLEALPVGGRPNARQRAAAADQVPVWLAARLCLKADGLRPAGRRLAGRAAEAARRQPDHKFALAIEREWGQLELAAGDKAEAARHWSGMVDLTLAQARGPKGEPVGVEAVVTATQIATLAAKNGHLALSFRAVREALRDGLRGPAPANPARPPRPWEAEDRPALRVGRELAALDRLWAKHAAPPADVYDTLTAAVFPAGQPGAIALYPEALLEPYRLEMSAARSGGRLLVEWAVRADRVADLQARIEARKAAEVPAHILLALLGHAAKDDRLLADNLVWLTKRAETDRSWQTAELLCHVALPALDHPVAGPAARATAALAADALYPTNEGRRLAVAIHLAVAQACGRAGDQPGCRRHLRDFLRLDEEPQYGIGGGPADYRVRSKLATAVGEYAAAGLWDDGWETLGRMTDLPTSPYAEADGADVLLARLARGLATQPAPARYDRLKAWVLPAGKGKAVRFLAGPAATGFVPPAAFGQFAVPPDGLLSTFGLLIDAAREAGRLDDLGTAAAAAVAAKTANAEPLLCLVQLARGRGSEAEAWVRARAAEVPKRLTAAVPARTSEAPDAPPAYPSVARMMDLVVARAALGEPRLREPAEALAAALTDKLSSAGGILYGRYRGLTSSVGEVIQSEAAAHRAARVAGGPPGPGPDLALWFPDQPRRPDRPLAGWLAHEGMITVVPGGNSQRLYFAYPLVGTFEFSVEASHIGGLEYGGRVFYFDGPSHWSSTGPRPGPNAFHRFTLQVTPEKVRCLVNGRAVFENTPVNPASPWLVLVPSGMGYPAFRNFSLTGSPQIPREVGLTHGDRADWTAAPAATRVRPAPESRFEVAEVFDPDWTLAGGELTGRRGAAPGRRTDLGRLPHERPLRSGESIRYEFLYEPGKTAVFPALGQLAFLLDPAGVRLHWIGGDAALGLTADNAVPAPGRRGPDRLPLRDGEWNAVTMSLAGDTVNLALNGVRVLEYPLSAADDRRFGLFYFQSRTQARARNVALRGAWPEALPETRADLTAPATPLTAADRRVRHAVIGEAVLSSGGPVVLRRATALAAAARYDLLRDWVLPGSDHTTFRLAGWFTPADPAPPVAGPDPHGGHPESPALALIAVAKELGKLDDLAERTRAAGCETDADRRAQTALVAAIAAAAGRDADAVAGLARLKATLPAVGTDSDDDRYWPDLTAVLAGLPRDAARDLLTAVVDRLGTKGAPSGLAGHARALLAGPGSEPRTAVWQATALPTAASRGAGRPRPVWELRDGELINRTGHPEDVAFVAVPLRGDFEVRGELTLDGRRSAVLAYGDEGFQLNPAGDRVLILSTERDRGSRSIEIQPPAKPRDGWVPFRLTVKAGACTLYVDDRMVASVRSAADPVPWLSFCPGPGGGGVRQLRITGAPIVPSELTLSGRAGWATRYYGESLYDYRPTWEWQGTEIIGRPADDPGRREKLVQYLRPLMEDGEIEYEFFVGPGPVQVHPALDRLALAIDRGGVRIHWLTDGVSDRSGLAVDNRTAEPDNRRGPTEPPLKLKAWNRATLRLVGDRVTLSLNGVEVFSRTLDPTNRRVFGFYQDPGADEVRVRNVRYRGQWGKELPKFE